MLLDDAFQHRRIHRDLDILLIDALAPFGFDHLLPRGLLREPVSGLRRAHCVILSRANLVTSAQRRELHSTVQQIAPQSAILEVEHKPLCWRQASGQQADLDTLRGQRVAAFCGIGNPAGFRRTLAQCGVELGGFKTFPDHHPFHDSDLESLARWARESNSSHLVCTAKDLVKIGVDDLHQLPLYCLEIGIAFLCGQDQLEQRLAAFLPPPAA